MLSICKRTMSSSTTRNVLKIERSAVKRNSGAFESHSNSATAQHRSKDYRGRTLPLQNGEESVQKSFANCFFLNCVLEANLLKPNS